MKGKIMGCKRRLSTAKWQLNKYKANRGSLDGTFWTNYPAVDKAIADSELKILAIENELIWLHMPSSELMQQLKSSEIF